VKETRVFEVNGQCAPYMYFNCHKSADVSSCASILKKGGVIVYPTDTLYAIGCNPYNENAVERIFIIKGRNKNNPLPILASTIKDIEELVSLNKIARFLANQYWPGALTIIAPLKDKKVSSKVTANKLTVGVRIPNNKCALALIKRCKYLIGTSANKSGEGPFKSSSEIISSSASFHGFDALLDGGKVGRGLESTIVQISNNDAKVIREGAIASEEIYTILQASSI
jgi:L-threonylcarbamoyladenylate synthase